jgi:glyoxylase-like metal-dependent hydrolase (beta-lactamase superfamily II)
MPAKWTAGELFYTDAYGEGDELNLAGLAIKVLHTPGHTPGSVCLMVENSIFCGDTLFAGSCGRTDLPGGDQNVLFKSLLRLAALEEDYTCYPGHSGSTTLAREKQYNPFIKRAKAAAEQEA